MVARKFSDLAVKSGFDAAKFILGYDPAAPVGQRFFRFGADSLAGVKGPDGEKGATGDKGPIGDKGATGNAGPAGTEKGPAGDKGPVGNQGATGDKGPSGDKGITGDKGATGDQGAKGISGDKGVTGDKGATGDKGLTGDKGATGDKGPSGDAGSASTMKSRVSKHELFSDFISLAPLNGGNGTIASLYSDELTYVARGTGSQMTPMVDPIDYTDHGTMLMRLHTDDSSIVHARSYGRTPALYNAGYSGKYAARISLGAAANREASQIYRAGLVYDVVNANLANNYGLWFDNNGTNWFAVYTPSGQTTAVRIDTGIASKTSGFDDLEIVWDTLTVKWYVNGTLALTVNRVNISLGYTLFAMIGALRVGTGTKQLSAYIDYMLYETEASRSLAI